MIKVSCPDIGPAAVYRTIQLPDELNLIDRVSFADGFVRYETGSAPDGYKKHHHHYLICRRYGGVFSFQEDLWWRSWKRKLPLWPDLRL